MAKKSEAIKEASLEDKQMLLSITHNKPDVVQVRGRNFEVRWTHPSVADWISDLMASKGNDGKILCQSAALIVLGGFWKCHLLYWLVWRWFYYIRQYSAAELSPIIGMAQKKTAEVGAVAYLNAMMFLTALDTTNKLMTKEEAKRSLQELRMGKDGSSPKSMG